jgi:predicted Zn-dependent peptidase
VVEQVQTLFGSWQGQATPTEAQQPKPTMSAILEHHESKQEHLALMCPFPNYTDPDYYAAMVLAEALGGNMASRLFVEVREKRGLVYGVSASQSSNKNLGALRIYAGTTPEQGHECLEVILNELRKLEQEGITADELERAKVQLKSENVMHGEGSGSRMSAIARSWWYQRKLKTIQQVKEAIDAVTQEQVLNVLRRFSPVNPLTIAGIGPLSEEELVGDMLATLS